MRYVFLIGLFFVTTSLVFNSCKKKRDDDIGFKGDGPGFPELVYTDTFTISASTVREDSIRTDDLTQFLLGKLHDPIFGISSSSIFTQLRLPQLNRPAPADATLDSAFLYVTFTSKIAIYGNLNSTQSFKVYELTEGFGNSNYYSTDSLSYNPTPIGSFTGQFNLNDSLRFINNGEKGATLPGIKIQLSADFAEKLLKAQGSVVSTHDAFSAYVKGLAFIPDNQPASGEGAVAGINLRNTGSRIFVYYNGSKQLDFQFTGGESTDDVKRFVKYNFSNQPVAVTSQKNNPGKSYDTTYLQSFTGAKTHFRFPSIYSLAQEGDIFLYKVELQIPLIPETISTDFPAPTRLLIVQPHPETGNNLQVPDFKDTAKFGGHYNAAGFNYTFNLTRHFQELLTLYKNGARGEEIHRGLFLIPTRDFPITPARAVIDSRTGSNEKLKLIIVYSKL